LIPIEDRLAAAGLPPLPRMAWLEIDLGAIVDNVLLLRGLAGADVPVHPVVKADAYGHGAIPVAGALVEAGVDGLCVATLDEGLALRAAGIPGPIHVLYPVPPSGVGDAATNRLSVTIGDRASEALLLEAVAALPAGTAQVAVHIEVETGLGRGGIDVADLASSMARLIAAKGVRPTAVWTHLQAPEDAHLTADQLARFDRAAAIARDAIPGIARHVAASAGILTGNVPAYDGIRPGLAVYGLVPDELAPGSPGALAGAALRPAMSMHARPVRVAMLPAGWGISYGPIFRTKRPSRIATLPFGYGDGWSRALSGRAEALVRGVRVPIVGRVAMDAVMVDVTDVPGRPVELDDAFVLIGRQGDLVITVADVARLSTTNAWEVVTSMARRVPRVYHSASGPTGLRTLRTLL
jgi:alanine racemase